MALILDGKKVSEAIDAAVQTAIENLYLHGVRPTIGILRIGDNPSDVAYENGAAKRAAKLGIRVERFTCPEDISQEDLLMVMDSINNDNKIHGLLMLRPLPKHIDEDLIRNSLIKRKDLDAITDSNLADIFVGGQGGFPPCTAESCIEILKFYDIPLEGKKCVVIGRSTVIGKPVAMMLMEKNATVTICHSKTPRAELIKYCKDADVIVVAAGKRGIFNAEMATENQTIIDVGINLNEEGKLCGDVDYENVEPIVKAITPVPGGVGSVTTSLLMAHLYGATAAAYQLGLVEISNGEDDIPSDAPPINY